MPRPPHPAARRLVGALVLPCLAAGARTARAQSAPGQAAHGQAAHGGPRVSAQLVAQAAGATPVFGGRGRTEASVTQPVVMAHAPVLGNRLRLTTTLNFEALTLRDGQLNPGTYGEGFVDRRHPHTVVHELVASAVARAPGARGLDASLAGGKGFVAFGTDDPMMRPFTLFPVNHHLAQLLERYVATAGLRAARAGVGSVLAEASVFGGDEPEGPWAWPLARRFGEAWAGRLTLRPALSGARRPAPDPHAGPGAHGAHGAHAGPAPNAPAGAPPPLELSASLARVPSPENRDGAGLDQRKASVAARWASGAPLGAAGLGDARPGLYALAEWARTDELRDARRAFRYESVLLEAAARRRGVELAARWERTTRPEEERLVDPFRTKRPHNEFNVLGLTQWRTATVNLAVPARVGALRLLPFVEAARAAPREVLRPSAFEPAAFYGAARLWTGAVGLRVGAGTPHARMGRYGVAAAH